MVQLKQVAIRLKSIKNIQKITKTMKMVAASKFSRAEQELRAARPFGYAPRKFYQSSHLVKGEVDAPDSKKDDKAKEPEPAVPEPAKPDDKDVKMRRIFVAMTSDRGMCGGVHSGVARRLRRELTERATDDKVNKLVCVGDKSRAILRRSFPTHIILSVKDIGRISPQFADASKIAAAITEAQFPYDVGEIYYNKFISAAQYKLSVIPFFNKYKIEAAPNMSAFDDIDDDMLESYSEWTLAAIMYYVLKEGAASEQSARMSAMDNASNNAGDMIKKLTIIVNRTRQAVITRELIEIISAAAALT